MTSGGIALRIGRIETVYIGQQHQHIRLYHRGDARRETIIVAIANFRRRDRVILVDHRHGAEAEQRCECFARIQVAAASFRVLKRQQDLRHRNPMHMKGIDISLREAHLAHRRGGLAFVQPQ